MIISSLLSTYNQRKGSPAANGTAWAQPADAVPSAVIKARARRMRDEWFANINRHITDVMTKGSDGRVARP